MPKIAYSDWAQTDKLKDALEYVSVLYSVTELTSL